MKKNDKLIIPSATGVCIHGFSGKTQEETEAFFHEVGKLLVKHDILSAQVYLNFVHPEVKAYMRENVGNPSQAHLVSRVE